MNSHIVIIGGGTAGISVAARLRKSVPEAKITLIEPSKKHFYQPLWTLVGGGIFPKEKSMRDESSVMPDGVDWIVEAAESIDAPQRTIITNTGRKVSYDWLVVCPGLQINWSKIPGLKEAIGTRQVCSNYSYQHVDYTWDTIRNFKGGKALFTHPSGAVKCGGAPQKILWLAEDWWRKQGTRAKANIHLHIALPNLFAVEKYRVSLEKEVATRDIHCHFEHNLVAIDADAKTATFEHLSQGTRETVAYDMIHVTPPMGPPDFLQHSGLIDAAGWMDVDKYSLRSTHDDRVFALGDCSNLPTSKTGAAIRKQAPVVVENLVAAMQGKATTARYNGYTSCPIVTARGKMILAEFDYDKTPMETFPFDQAKPRYSMYLLKKWLLPIFYWHGMLKGRM